MAVSLGFHIVFAALGIGLPLLLVFTEFLAIRRDDEVWMALTRRWSKALGILVAVGAVSGTVLSLELGWGIVGLWVGLDVLIAVRLTLLGLRFAGRRWAVVGWA